MPNLDRFLNSPICLFLNIESGAHYVQDNASVISELLSVKSSSMDLSILSDSDIDFCIHQF